MHTFPAVGIPHEELPTVVATAARGQPCAIRTPGQTEEDGVIRIEVPQDLDTGACDWVPQADGMIQSTTGEPTAIRTPRDAVHAPAMSAQHPGCRATFHLPQGHQAIRARTG